MSKFSQYGIPDYDGMRWGGEGSLSRRETWFQAGASSVLQRQAAERTAAAIRAELGRPLPKIPERPTRCRVLTASFRHRERGGETYVPDAGDVITMPLTEARAAAALGRVSILKTNGANT
jgi:hypothetical protein